MKNSDFWIGLYNYNEQHENFSYKFYFTDGVHFDALAWKKANNFRTMQVDKNENYTNSERTFKEPFYCSTFAAENSIISVDCYEKRKAFICKLGKNKFNSTLNDNNFVQNNNISAVTTPTDTPIKKIENFDKIKTNILKPTTKINDKLLIESNTNTVFTPTSTSVLYKSINNNVKNIELKNSNFDKMPKHLTTFENEKNHEKITELDIQQSVIDENNFLQYIHSKLGPNGTFILLFLIVATLIATIMALVLFCYRQNKYKKKYMVYNTRMETLRNKTNVV